MSQARRGEETEDEDDPDVEMEEQLSRDEAGSVAGKILLLESGGTEVSPKKFQDKKRARKDGESYVSNQNAIATSSSEEGHRAQ